MGIAALTVMATDNTDADLLARIEGLVQEEQTLYHRGDLDDGETSRLEELRVKLDQYWDLLRQRRALRKFGKDPDQARERPADIVERYEQ